MTNDFGARPVFSELIVDQLHVDSAYQRDTTSRRSQQSIRMIVRKFQWVQFGVVLVMPWPEVDGFAILDGQHRVEAAKALGIERVPCMVYPPLSKQEAARIFVGVNQNRVSVTPMALFYAQLAAGDEEAITMQAIAEAADVVICKYPKQASDMKPGETLAVGTIRQFAKSSPDVGVEALEMIRDAYGETPGVYRADLMRGLFHTLEDPGLSREALRDYLADRSFDGLYETIMEKKEQGEWSVWAAARQVFLSEIAGKPRQTAEPPRAPETSLIGRRPVITEANDKVFDQPVTRRCDCGAVFIADRVSDVWCAACKLKEQKSANG